MCADQKSVEQAVRLSLRETVQIDAGFNIDTTFGDLSMRRLVE